MKIRLPFSLLAKGSRQAAEFAAIIHFMALTFILVAVAVLTLVFGWMLNRLAIRYASSRVVSLVFIASSTLPILLMLAYAIGWVSAAV